MEADDDNAVDDDPRWGPCQHMISDNVLLQRGTHWAGDVARQASGVADWCSSLWPSSWSSPSPSPSQNWPNCEQRSHLSETPNLGLRTWLSLANSSKPDLEDSWKVLFFIHKIFVAISKTAVLMLNDFWHENTHRKYMNTLNFQSKMKFCRYFQSVGSKQKEEELFCPCFIETTLDHFKSLLFELLYTQYITGPPHWLSHSQLIFNIEQCLTSSRG